jgi:hypothetical protein
MPALEPHDAADQQQCDDQAKAGAGPGKADQGIDPDTETARCRFSS